MTAGPDPAVVERLLAATQAYESEGMAAWIDVLHPQVDWEVSPDLPNPGREEGPDGVLESVEDWEDAWSEIRYRSGEVFGDGARVVVEMHTSMVGATSGITVENTTWWASEVRDGLVIRGGIYPDRESAAARLGL